MLALVLSALLAFQGPGVWRTPAIAVEEDGAVVAEQTDGEAALGSAVGDETSVADDAVADDDADGAPEATEGQQAAATDDVAVVAAGDAEPASYNPDAAPKVIGEGTASSATLGLFKDAQHTQPLGDDAVTVNDTVYGELEIAFAYDDLPTLESPNVWYQLPSNVTVAAGRSGTLEADGSYAGTWKIVNQGGVTYAEFQYDGEWLSTHPSGIRANVDFEFSVADKNASDGDEVEVVFPGVAEVVTIPIKGGDVTGGKSAQFNADDQTITWTVSLNAPTGASNLTVTDTLGTNLAFVPGSFALDGTAIAEPQIDGQTATIALGDVKAGWHSLTYKTSVTPEALAALANGEELSDDENFASWTWGADGANSGQISQPVRPSNIKYDIVEKSAADESTPDDITWWVVLNGGNLKADMSGYTYTDTLGQGQAYKGSYVVRDVAGNEVATGELDPSASSFAYAFPEGLENGRQTYTIEYHTQMTDVSSKDAVTNTGSVAPAPGTQGPAGSSTGTFTPADEDTYVTKALVDSSAAGADGTARWSSTIGFSSMAAGTSAASVKYADRMQTPKYAQVTFSDVVLTCEDGTTLVEGVDYAVSCGWTDLSIQFKDTEAVRALIGMADVQVTYVTTTPDVTSGTYHNYASVSTDKVSAKSAEASYTVEKAVPVLKSAGAPKWDADFDWSLVDPSDSAKGAWVVDWTVTVNRNSASEWAAAGNLTDDVTVTDALPEGMSYVPGSGKFDVVFPQGGGTSVWGHAAEAATSAAGVTFSVPMTQLTGTEGPWAAFISLQYRTVTKASAVAQGTEGTTFTNVAEASSGQRTFPAGSATVTIVDKPLSKTATQVTGSDSVRYTIHVNPTASDLVAGSDTITLTDTMDAKCTFKAWSLQVTDSRTGEAVTGVATRAENVTSEDGSVSTRLTITLPDERALDVSYEVRPAGEVGETVHLRNEASLSGVATSGTAHEQNWVVQRAAAGTVGEAFGVSITKIDADDLQTKLSGATFALWRVDMDAALVAGVDASSTLVEEGVTENGAITFGSQASPLAADTLYYFEETAAPEGYEVASGRTYVLLKGTGSTAAADYAEALAKAQALGLQPSSATTYSIFDNKKPAAPDVPASSTNDKPSSSTGDKPSSSTNDKPSSSENDKPSSSTNDKPSSSQSDKPASSENDKPSSSTGDKPSTSENDKPSSSQSDKPSSSTGDKPGSSQNDKPSSSTQDKPSSSQNDRPSSSTQDKPSSSTADKPSSSTQDKPSSSTGDKPSSSENDKPSSSTGDRPSSSTNDRPSSSTHDAPASSENDKPSSSTHDVPASSTGDKPSSSVSDVPASSTHDVPSVPSHDGGITPGAGTGTSDAPASSSAAADSSSADAGVRVGSPKTGDPTATRAVAALVIAGAATLAGAGLLALRRRGDR